MNFQCTDALDQKEQEDAAFGAPGIATRNKKLLGAPGHTSSNKKLLGATRHRHFIPNDFDFQQQLFMFQASFDRADAIMAEAQCDWNS